MDHDQVNAVCVEVDVFVLSCGKQLLLVMQQQSSVRPLAHLWIFAWLLKSVWWCRHSVRVFTQQMNALDPADIQNAVHFWMDRVAVLLTSNICGCRFILHSVKLFGTYHIVQFSSFNIYSTDKRPHTWCHCFAKHCLDTLLLSTRCCVSVWTIAA